MRFAVWLGAVVLLAGTASSGAAQVPAGKVLWHDLVTPSLEISKAFYSDLFGWTWRAPSSGKGVTYVVGELTGAAMAGLAESGEGKKNPSQWITYFSVPDVKRSTKAADDSGAKVVVRPTTTGSWHDESALLTDPQGAAFALMKRGAEPDDSASRPTNDWLWVELWTADVDSAAAFYSSLLGYGRKPIIVAGQGYTLFLRDSTPAAGMLRIPVKDVRPNWLPTIRVTDVRATVAKAMELGGRVIMAPRDDVRSASVAIIADPTGAALAVQQWSGPSVVAGSP